MTHAKTQEADLILAGASQVVTFRGVGRGEVADAVAASTLTEASVAMADGCIVDVGPASEIKRRVRLRPGGESLDCRGQVILPGLMDAHTHLPFAGLRADEFRRRLAGDSYEDIARAGGGIRATLAATRRASLTELVENCLARMDRMLLHGVTTAEAKSGYGLDLPTELRQLRAICGAGRRHPVALVPTLLAAHIVPPEMSGRRQEYLDLMIQEILPAVVEQDLARFCDVFIDDGAFTVDEAGVVLRAARDAGLGLRVHADQLGYSGAAGGGGGGPGPPPPPPPPPLLQLFIRRLSGNPRPSSCPPRLPGQSSGRKRSRISPPRTWGDANPVP
ncbi:MAG: hypothetical protein ACE5ID_06835 [Acidobacteriota bacterium]